jgi:hypothetical protein
MNVMRGISGATVVELDAEEVEALHRGEVLNHCDVDGERLTIVGEQPMKGAARALRRFRDGWEAARR